MNNKLITILILTLLSSFNKAYAIIEFNDNCKKGFEYTIALDHEKSSEYLLKETIANPNNSAILYIKTYEAFLNFVTNGNQKSLDDFDDIKEIAIDKISDEPGIPANIEYVADRLGHDRKYALDCKKLKAYGGDRIFAPLEIYLQREPRN